MRAPIFVLYLTFFPVARWILFPLVCGRSRLGPERGLLPRIPISALRSVLWCAISAILVVLRFYASISTTDIAPGADVLCVMQRPVLWRGLSTQNVPTPRNHAPTPQAPDVGLPPKRWRTHRFGIRASVPTGREAGLAPVVSGMRPRGFRGSPGQSSDSLQGQGARRSAQPDAPAHTQPQWTQRSEAAALRLWTGETCPCTWMPSTGGERRLRHRQRQWCAFRLIEAEHTFYAQPTQPRSSWRAAREHG